MKFLPICKGNRVAAIILDYVFTLATIFDRVETDEPFLEALGFEPVMEGTTVS